MSAWTSRKTKGLLNNILLSAGCIMAVLFLAEAVLRLTPYKQLLSASIYHFPQYYFKPDKEAGFDIRESFSPSTVVFSGEPQIYSTWSNEIGCFDYPCAGISDYILLTGDSFAWGFAAFDDKFGSVIEKSLGIRVFKCGVPGYGPKQYLLKIKKIVNTVKAAPKLIIVGYYIENDLLDDLLCPRHAVIPGDERYLVTQTRLVSIESGQIKRCSQIELLGKLRNLESYGVEDAPASITSLAAARTRIFLKRHSIIANLAKNSGALRVIGYRLGLVKYEPLVDYCDVLVSFIPADKYAWLAKAWKAHLDNLRQIKAFADDIKSQLLIVLIPDKIEQVYGFLAPKGLGLDVEQPNRILADFFRKEKINYIDLFTFFKQYAVLESKNIWGPQGDLYWNFDPHFNKKGNALAGLLVSRCIIENDLMAVADKIKKKEVIAGKLQRLRTFDK